MAWKVIDDMAVDTRTGEIMARRTPKQVRTTKGKDTGWYRRQVEASGKLATAVLPPATEEPPPEETRDHPWEQPAMFDAPAAPAKRRSPLYVCGVQGGWGDWATGYWGRNQPRVRPVCNRAPGHDGPHRQVRRRDFAVVAEWA